MDPNQNTENSQVDPNQAPVDPNANQAADPNATQADPNVQPDPNAAVAVGGEAQAQAANNPPVSEGDKPSQPVAPEAIHTLRKDIDQRIVDAKNFKVEIGHGAGAREIALVITKLQEAKMWAGKILEELGSTLPPEFQDKAE